MATLTIRRTIEVALQQSLTPAGGVSRELFDPFVRAFLKRTDDKYLVAREPASILAQFGSQLSFLAQRSPDEIKVRVFNPSLEEEGYTLDHTVVETCMNDQPFLLDTLRLLYRTREIRELECLHPILDLHRGCDGQLDRVGPPSEGGEPGHKESVMHFEIERIDDPKAREELRLAILERLRTAQAVVRDFRPLLGRIDVAITELLAVTARSPERRAEAEEAAAFLRWLSEDNFIFMGHELFTVLPAGRGMKLEPVAGERLGLRAGGEGGTALLFPEVGLSWLDGEELLFFGKDETESRVHRSGKIDTLLVRQFDQDGQLKAIRLISGLLTYKGVSQDGAGIPILRMRLKEVLQREEAIPGSHLYKAIISGMNSIPVEYLFGSDVEAIRQAVDLLISAENRNDTAVSIRIDPSRRSAFVLSSMPRRHYDEELREEISRVLLEALGASYHDHRLVLGELDNVVLELYLTAPGGLREVEVPALEARILQLARPWEERFEAVLAGQCSGERAEALAEAYREGFTEAYTLATSPDEGVRDVMSLEALRSTGQLQFRVSRDGEEPGSAIVKLKMYERTNIYLTDSLPILDNFGLRVVDQSACMVRIGEEVTYIDTFRVGSVRGRPECDLTTREQDLADGLRAVFSGRADDDMLNRLVLVADLNWRQVDVIRGYVAYSRQLDNVPMDFIRRVWLNHPKAAQLLIEFFEIKFDPSLDGGIEGEKRAALLELPRERFISYLKGVESSAEDRVLRTLFRLVEGTVRTNYFRTPTRDFFSFKLDSDKVHGTRTGLRPFREIFVHHHAVEGIHLRGGPIARGGLRWSDRYDDYRTEILDLMKTQMEKNTIIVPVGAKGGFILKQQYASRELERAQADEMYKIFIRGLLDVTDNIVEGRTVHPDRVLAYDGDDPYLVVAADKGTAHLSDTANAISLEYGHWLGDAFASGGSRGYDHKKEAITARGAWECVKRHFREIGIDPEREVFTAIGIGDMSGDVFGNGMLLSRTMKLLAAFNHMHIFLDPNPDPEMSFVERKRLFDLPRSTWDDYNRALISEGGGIFRRTAKAIQLTPQVQALLGVTDTVLSGDEVVKRILTADVDLLWNGGIGTYVKAVHETNADVGDRVNDAVRVNGQSLRARIVAEGGNLGFTQWGRIEYARHGGRLNTDAVDNSAGVDMSDHEVNLKILFQPLMASGALGQEERDALLVRMTDDVAAAVLEDNFYQSMLISLDQLRSADNLSKFAHVLDDLEEAMDLNRAAARLPDAADLEARAARGEGLTRPELAKLAAYSKMRVKSWLLNEERLRGPFLDGLLAGYFPTEIRERFGDVLRRHPLRREIVTTVVVNKIINAAGVTFFQEMYEDTGHSAPEIAMAYLVSSEILGADRLKRAICAPENQIPAAAQYAALLRLESALAAHTRRTLRRYDVFEPMTLIQRLKADFQDLHLTLVDVLPARALESLEEELAHYQRIGIPAALAREFAAFPYLASGSDIALLREESGLELPIAAWLYHKVGEETRVKATYELAQGDGTLSRWEKSALAVLRGQLIDLQYRMALEVASGGGNEQPVQARLTPYLEARQPVIARVKALEQRLGQGRVRGVAPVTVLTEVIQEMVR